MSAQLSPLARMRTVGYAKANWTPLVRFPRRYLAPGRYAYRIVMQAAFNPLRQRVVVSRTFVVR